MAYSPFQARDANGRWVAKAGNAIVGRAAKRRKTKRSLAARERRQRTISQRMPGRDVSSKAKLPIGTKAARRGRGEGLSGLKKNTVPYVRANKRSQTVGVNAGTIIPGTNRRVVIGGYARIESTTKHTGVDRALNAAAAKAVGGKGTRRARVASAVTKRVSIKNPALRKAVGGGQFRLGTSRSAGPTVIVRRGKHKTPQSKTAKGVQRYDARMHSIAGKKAATKKPRPQRRKAGKRRR